MSLEMQGLSEFQRDLLEVAQRRLPKETKKVMRKIGNKAKTSITKEARARVKKKSGNYQKKFKRGKPFDDSDGQTVIRVYNSSPHAHLIEYGHRQVDPSGREIGFVTGKKVIEKGIQNFDSSGQFEHLLSEWLDELLESGDL